MSDFIFVDHSMENADKVDNITINGTGSGSQSVELDVTGKYWLSGSFGNISGSVTVLNGGKSVGKGKLKKGVLTFNNGKPILLDSTLSTVISVTAKTGTNLNYVAELKVGTVFGVNDFDSKKNPQQIGVVDTAGTVLVSNGWVGFGDENDYFQMTLTSPAKLALSCNSTDVTKFTIYNSKGKQKASGTLKKSGSLITKAALLEAGTYYLEVRSTNAKKGGNANYRVAVANSTVFYTKGDNSDDVYSAAGVPDLGTVSAYQYGIADGWVGYGDAIDYKKITLASAARIAFAIHSTDAAKLTVYQSSRGRLGKAKASVAVSPRGTGVTKSTLLPAGTYYLAVQSTNAKKGGNADYTLDVDPNTVFFGQGNTADNVYTAAKNLGSVSVAKTLDNDWVGYGDEIDYKVFTLDAPAYLRFYVSTTDTTKLTFSRLFNGRLNPLLRASFATEKTPTASASKIHYTDTTDGVFVQAGTYYLAMQSTNAKKGGNADYSIAISTSSIFYAKDYTGQGPEETTTTTTTTTTSTESYDFAFYETEASVAAAAAMADFAAANVLADAKNSLGNGGLLVAI